MSELVDSNSLDDKIKLSESEMNGSLDDEDAINLDDPAGIMDLDDDDSKSPDFEKLETIEDLEDEDVEEEIREAESIGDPIEDDENGDDLDKLILDETDRLSTSSHGYQKLNSDESCDKFLSSDDKNRLDENSCSVRGGSDSQENSREATSLQSNGMDKTRQLEQDDDDKPVSIPSDTNSEDEPDEEEHDGDMGTANKTNGTCDSPEVHEILSDKEDCVVIEDSLSPAKAYDSQQRRQRKSTIRAREYPSYDDDIEEIIEDPIAINSTTTIQPVMKKAKLTLPPSTQLSLRDANGNRSSNIGSDLSITPSGGKGSSGKEPTLVLIDTKSILNNRNNSNARNSPATSLANLSKNIGFSISPVAAGGGGTSMASSNLPGMYPQPNIRATITPINNSSNNNKSTTATIANNNSSTKSSSSSSTPSQQQQQQLMNSVPHTQLPALIPTHSNGGNILLPALTDDMFVLEAPSFIVPYIYEKPPPENLKEVVGQIGTILAQQRKKTGGQQPDEKREDGVGVKKAEDGVQQGQQEAGKKNRRKGKNPDDSWDESDTSTDEEASDSETRTKVLIKEANQDIETIILPTDTSKPEPSVENKPVNSDNYFESPLGQFFMAIGVNLVQEHVQTDLMRIQKKKAIREGAKPSAQVQTAINALMKNLEVSKKSNKPFKFENKRCEFCNFKSESALVMTNHYEKPHLRGNAYRCNFCEFETRPAHDMLFHMEAVHNVKSKLDKPLSYHQCPNCPFEDNGKSKLARHSLACTKKFMPETNLTPPPDWDPPAKIPRVKPRHGLVGTATAYQAMAAQQQRINAAGILNRMNMGANVNNINNTNTIGLMNNSNITNLTNNAGANRNRGRPQVGGHNLSKGMGAGQGARGQGSIRSQLGCDMMMPNNFNQLAAKHLNNNQLLQMAANQAMMPNTHSSLTIQSSNQGSKSSKNMQQPSISITPLPRQGTSVSTAALQAAQAAALKSGMPNLKPGQHPSGGKSTFVICEICDGYIKDLDQLRSHMQLIHKVKIHPKMIYNRPPLNCQKCQYRFFTDQGLERHLLGSHGLVTSSMQEAANCGQDSGRCPVCGRVYQWKLLNHVSRDHNMTLKPAHLSYKCTVCTATFGMYKQFENHVYSAHSTVAKKSGDGSKRGSSSASSSGNNNNNSFGGSSKSAVNSGDSLLKPLKINDEITIIPQPPTKTSSSMAKTQTIEIE